MRGMVNHAGGGSARTRGAMPRVVSPGGTRAGDCLPIEVARIVEKLIAVA